MKKILLIVLLASCTSKKEKIVEQMKSVDNEYKKAYHEEAEYNSNPNHNADTSIALMLNSLRLKAEHDSLEMELKKY